MGDLSVAINCLNLRDVGEGLDSEDEITQKIGQLMLRATRDRKTLAVLCGILCRMKGVGAARVNQLLISKFPDYAAEIGWVSRLCRAGLLLIDYPELNDQSIDRICILRRLPRYHHAEVFTSGRLPNGVCFREIDREQLRFEINKLSTPKPKPPNESIERRVKRELIAFANSIPNLVDQLAVIPEYQDIRRSIDQWHKELISSIQKHGPKLRETIYVSPTSTRNVANGV